MDKTAIRRSLMDTWGSQDIRGEMERRNFTMTDGMTEQVCVCVSECMCVGVLLCVYVCVCV
jgi:hypothetical protein